MPELIPASSFTLKSVDHDRVLLDSEVHSTRHLLGTESLESPPKQLEFEFTHDGVTRSTTLTREQGSFAEGTILRLAGEDGVEELEVPAMYNYYSEDRDWVLTFHNDKKFTGMVVADEKEEVVHFTGEKGKVFLDHHAKKYFDSLPNPKRSLRESKGRKTSAIDKWDDCHDAQPDMATLNIGAAVGNVMYQNFGNDALSMVNSYIAESNMIYERQMDISLKIADTFVATSSNVASWTSNTCSISIQNQLNGMRSWREPTRQPLWHLFDDCFGASGNILGIAYVGTLCSSSTNVGVSYYSEDFDPVGYPTWATVAHELGHNFNAQHSFEDGQGRTGGIMDYGPLPSKLIDGDIQFNTKYRENEVCREVSTAVRSGCATSRNEFVEVELTAKESVRRDLNCVKHSNRGIASTQRLFFARTGVTLSQCKTQCEASEFCDTFTYSDSGHCETWTQKDADDLIYAAQFDTYFCSEGAIPEGRLAEKSVDDLLQEANVEVIGERCCEVREHEHVAGLNRWFKENVSKEQCHLECLQNTGCDAASFDIAFDACMFFGGQDYSNEFYNLNGVSTLVCDRQCVSDNARGLVSDSSSGDIAGSVVPIAGVVALVAVVGGVYRKFTKGKK